MPPNPPRRRIHETIRRLRDSVEDGFRNLLAPRAVDPAGPEIAPHLAGAPPNIAQNSGESQRGVKARLRSALQRLHSHLDFLPPLKSAVGVMIECIDFMEESTPNHQEYNELALNLANIIEGLRGHLSQSQPTQMPDHVKEVIRLVVVVLPRDRKRLRQLAANSMKYSPTLTVGGRVLDGWIISKHRKMRMN
ncbi:hypothetical protein FS749_005846 [Ceratobasidium sp. UAMH 11750]|nr:hypothetical protein FS749_005846 [Ceratobasidium sp. UAMH 11750]